MNKVNSYQFIHVAMVMATLGATLLASSCAGRKADRTEAHGMTPVPAVAATAPADTVAIEVGASVEQDPWPRFTAWRRTWAQTAPAERPALVAPGEALARERGAWMRGLIASDPRQAIAVALPAAERDALPPEVARHVERQIAGRGFYGVLSICDHGLDGGAGHANPGCSIRREAVIAGEYFNAHVFGSRLKRITEDDAILSGIALDAEAALAEGEDPADPALPAPTAGPEQPEAAGPTLDPSLPPAGPTPPTVAYNEYTGSYGHQFGPKTIMVMLVEPSDGAAWTSPPTFATLDSQTTSASQWWFNVSYGLTWFGPKYRNPGTASEILIPRLVVTPVLKLPKTAATYNGSFGTLQTDCKAAVEAQGGTWVNNGVNDPDHYDRWVVMSNTKMISSTGLAYVGWKFAWTGGGINGGVAQHEHGHNWGVFHANAWTVAAGADARATTGGHGEYNDGRDIMGGNGSIGFNPIFLETLGFLRASEGEIVTVTGSGGTYRLYDRVDPYAKNAVSKVRALMIPVTGTTTSSKRVMLGFAHDGGTDGGSGRSDWERNAVGVHSDNTSADAGNNDGSHRLDTSPGSLQSGDENDSAIPLGRTWSEGPDVNGTCPGFHVTPIARGSIVGPTSQTHQWIDVKVVLGQASGNAAPVASIALSKSSAAVGEAITLTCNASDANGDTLAYRWTYGDGRYSLANASVQTQSWATAGLYRVDVQVSDCRGGTTTASAWVEVGGSGAIPAVTTGAVLNGLEYRYHEGFWTKLPDLARQRPLAGGAIAGIDLTPRLRNDGFGFAYEGYIVVPSTDVYTFTLSAEDSAGLWIAGRQVALKNGVTSTTTWAQGNIWLAAGAHAVRIEYAHRDGSEALALDWETLSAARVAVPASVWRRPDRGGDAAPTVACGVPATPTAVGGTAALAAAASDADDAIVKVQWFWNRALIGEDATAPYALDWTGLWAGDKDVVAVAWSADGRYAVSAPATVAMQAVQVRPSIGIDLKGASGSQLSSAQIAGAVHRQANWNTVATAATTVSGLLDASGAVTTAAVTTNFTHQNGQVNANAELAEADGILLDGAYWTRDTGTPARLTVSGIPYATYEVYVYFDAALDASADATLGSYNLDGLLRYGRNSLNNTDQLGDWPTYDSWVGYRAATATATGDPTTAQLGNYLVFSGRSGATLMLDVQVGRPLSAIQIVEVPSLSNAAPVIPMPAAASPALITLP